jgi:alkaline phosphatase
MLKNKFKVNKKAILLLLAVLLISTTLFSTIYASNMSYSKTKTSYWGKTPKYVFLFIGDGMSYAQINSAEIYEGNETYGDTVNIDKLNFSEFPVEGTCTTFDAESFIPDSASTATALATGNKTLSGVLSMDTSKTVEYDTIAELLQEKGYKIGVVSSVSLNHATPAAFYAHQPTRKNYYEIGLELVESKFDYFAGGGLLSPEGDDEDQENIIDIAKESGYTYANSNEDILALNNKSGKVIAVNSVLDDSQALPYEIDREEDDLSLADFTEKGIDVLYKKKSKGFFMMVESGKIDWACHANDAGASINDTLAFEDAVDEALEFYKKHPKETLIIVTGDHECGGMTLGFAGTGYDTFYDKIGYQTESYLAFNEKVEEYRENNSADDAKLEDLLPDIKASFGLITDSDSSANENEGMVLSDYEIEKLEDALKQSMIDADDREYSEGEEILYGGYEPLTVSLTHILNNKAGISWTSYSHTALPLPVYAKGVGDDLFDGSYDNTDVFKKLASIMNVD